MRIVVIDMGTNVYNMLLAEVDKGMWQSLGVLKQSARLGDGGLSRGFLTAQAFDTASGAVDRLLKQLKRWGGADKLYAFATSAVRDAQNGQAFASFIKEKYSVDVQIISGDREADLIYKGIRQGAQVGKDPILMLDIGGGSNEFIIANEEKVFWKHSFPLGMARLLERFKPGNPITSEEVRIIEAYLNEELALLWSTLNDYKLMRLVGSSGSFDTYRSLLTEDAEESTPSYAISMEAFDKLYQRLLNSTTDERYAMKGMTPVRVDFIVLAAIFTKLVLDKTGIADMMQCSYSLKEGAMQEIADTT
jgi:exopolyphosphatase/guanosine-5'-triphosphate,3'-diphosphate pyrophosphatase